MNTDNKYEYDKMIIHKTETKETKALIIEKTLNLNTKQQK